MGSRWGFGAAEKARAAASIWTQIEIRQNDYN